MEKVNVIFSGKMGGTQVIKKPLFLRNSFPLKITGPVAAISEKVEERKLLTV